MSNYISLSYSDILLASLLMSVNLVFSFVLKLGLARSLLIASIRMMSQLLLIGYILEWLFRLKHPLFILLMTILMTVFASQAAVSRTKRTFSGVFYQSFIAILFSAFLITSLSLKGIIKVDPWFEPQYLIPLLGMVLGNTLTGVSLGLDRFLENLTTHKNLIESKLALGASAWEALHQDVREAVKTGMIPILNSMTVMGIVSLPGMMTGQILAGTPPIEAVRYQIVIVFMIAAGTALGTFSIVMLAYLSLISKEHRLLLDKIVECSNT